MFDTLNTLSTLLALLALGTIPTNAHSWVEQMQVISDNGTYVGDYGYMRGYQERGTSGDLDYLIPAAGTRITPTDLLCPPEQRSPSYTEQFPKLKAQPGDFVAIKYLENGHVTLPHNQPGKPRAGGTVFIFGTTQPDQEEKLADVMQWTADGKGGNGNGYLMTAQNFDDGRCYQLNDGSPISAERQKLFPDPLPGQPESVSESWCETDVQIPESQGTDKPLTIYWVWSWPTAPGAPGIEGGKDEYYTSCADIDLVDEQPGREIIHTIGQQDPRTEALKDFKSRFAYTTSPVLTLSGGATVPASEASRLSEVPTGAVELPASEYWSAFSASIDPAITQIQRIAAGEEAAPTPPVKAFAANPPQEAKATPPPASPTNEARPSPAHPDTENKEAAPPAQSGMDNKKAQPSPAEPITSTSTITEYTTVSPSNLVIVTQLITVTALPSSAAAPPSNPPPAPPAPSASAPQMPSGDGVGLTFSTIARPAAPTPALSESDDHSDANDVAESKRSEHVRKHARSFGGH
ncbi:hypothetical protein MBLNU230_g3470t1 [Neophaeotheca triangularis]